MFNSNEEIQIIGIDLGDNLDMKNQYIINEEMTKLNEKLTLKSRYDNAIKRIERLNDENKQYKEYIKELKDSLRNYHIKNNKLTNENGRLNNIINKLEKELKEGSFDVYICSTSSQKSFKSNEIIIKAMILDKLKELKEGK